MILRDSHAHASPYWGEPVESLLYHMDRAGTASAVLLQMMNGQANNDYLLECARRFPGRFASVVYLEPEPAPAETLAQALDHGASGIRLPPVAEFGGADMVPLWAAANARGVSISCGGRLREMASDGFAELIRPFGDAPIVIEHMGGHPLDPDDSIELRRKVYALAAAPNVYLKLSGVGTFVRRTSPFRIEQPYASPPPPYYEMALEAFGPGRLMWGSDYSPVSGRDGYEGALGSAIAALPGLSDAEQALVFGDVCRDVFPIVADRG